MVRSHIPRKRICTNSAWKVCTTLSHSMFPFYSEGVPVFSVYPLKTCIEFPTIPLGCFPLFVPYFRLHTFSSPPRSECSLRILSILRAFLTTPLADNRYVLLPLLSA
jgi:hypothetical protein